ncbi:MAG: VOC family protein [Terriglobia bacterium]|jgi:PhnB protein
MAKKVKAVPVGTHTITPHLSVREAPKAIEFYQKAFGAKVLGVHKTPDGKVMHATLKIGDSRLMLADEFPGMGTPAPQSLGGSPVLLNIYVKDVDALFKKAVDAGAKVTMPLANQFWGDRYGQIVDPFGHSWALGSHVEDVKPKEMERRANAIFAEMAKKQ